MEPNSWRWLICTRSSSQSFCLEGLLWNYGTHGILVPLYEFESQSFCLEGLLWNLVEFNRGQLQLFRSVAILLFRGTTLERDSFVYRWTRSQVAILLFRGTTLERDVDTYLVTPRHVAILLFRGTTLEPRPFLDPKDSIIRSQSFCLEGLLWNLPINGDR